MKTDNELLFSEYERIYKNYEMCLKAFHDIIVVCKVQNNVDIADIVADVLGKINYNKEKKGKTMTIRELLDYLKKYPKDAEIQFTDVCGNWEFDLYNVESYDGKIYIVGDEEH